MNCSNYSLCSCIFFEMLSYSSLEIISNEKALAKLDRDTFTYLRKRDDLKAKEVELFKISVK